MEINKVTERILMASILTGLIPGFITPSLWPFVIYFVEGKFPDLANYPMAAVTIAFFAILIGLGSCLFLGFPTLLTLSKYKINRPLISSMIGMVFSLALFLIMFGTGQNQMTISESWPIATLFAILGLVCGTFASVMSRPNKSLKPGDA